MTKEESERLKRIALKAVADQRFMRWKRGLVDDDREAPPLIRLPVRDTTLEPIRGVRAVGANSYYQLMPAWMRRPLKPPGR